MDFKEAWAVMGLISYRGTPGRLVSGDLCSGVCAESPIFDLASSPHVLQRHVLLLEASADVAGELRDGRHQPLGASTSDLSALRTEHRQAGSRLGLMKCLRTEPTMVVRQPSSSDGVIAKRSRSVVFSLGTPPTRVEWPTK